MAENRVDARQRPQVIFGVLPFSEISPALDASTLATVLKTEGVPTRVLYFNRVFAAKVSPHFYDAAAATVPLNSLLGDWVFRHSVFGDMDDRSYFRSLLDRAYISASLIPLALQAKAAVNDFLQECLGAVDWRDVVCLCLVDTYAKRDAVAGQLMASLALANAVKAQFPNVCTILAGPSTEGAMGRALAALPFVNRVCTGDVYSTLPPLVKEALESGDISSSPPFTHEHPPCVTSSKPAGRARVDLDLPIPDFDDYFALEGDGLPGRFDSLPMETSKGCWWAERSHCSFCALPGSDVMFRSKPPTRALDELRLQVERYRPKRIEMTDLIIDDTYFTSFFPALCATAVDVELFYETKAYLDRRQLELMARAGVTKIQAGIETLSGVTLRRLSKGVSVAANIRFLVDCHDLGIDCYWNYLHSVPGETAPELLSAIPTIENLTNAQPPTTYQSIRVERFSPYFGDPMRYGIDAVRPDRSYELVYEDSGIDVRSLALYFEHDESSVDAQARRRAVRAVGKALDRWWRRQGARSARTKHIV